MIGQTPSRSGSTNQAVELTEAERELAKLIGVILADQWIEAQKEEREKISPETLSGLDSSRKSA